MHPTAAAQHPGTAGSSSRLAPGVPALLAAVLVAAERPRPGCTQDPLLDRQRHVASRRDTGHPRRCGRRPRARQQDRLPGGRLRQHGRPVRPPRVVDALHDPGPQHGHPDRLAASAGRVRGVHGRRRFPTSRRGARPAAAPAGCLGRVDRRLRRHADALARVGAVRTRAPRTPQERRRRDRGRHAGARRRAVPRGLPALTLVHPPRHAPRRGLGDGLAADHDAR